MSISLHSVSIDTLATVSVDDIASSVLNNESSSASEFKRQITYQENPTRSFFAFGSSSEGAIYLYTYQDSHLAQNALNTGYDIHFQSPNNQELPFELVGYSNGTGAWWVKINSSCYTAGDNNLTFGHLDFYMLYGDGSRTIDASSSSVWQNANYCYPIVIHANYLRNDSASSWPRGTINYPSLGYVKDSNNLNIRPINSSQFNGMNTGSPIQLVSDTVDRQYPWHIGYIRDALPYYHYSGYNRESEPPAIESSLVQPRDTSISLTASGGLAITTSNNEPYNEQNTIMLGVRTKPGSLIESNGGSAAYEVNHVIGFCDLHVFARGGEYIAWIEGSSYTPITAPGPSMNDDYPPVLLFLTRDYTVDSNQNAMTWYRVGMVGGNGEMTSIIDTTASGHVTPSVTGIRMGEVGFYSNPAIDALRPSSGSDVYDTDVVAMELICPTSGVLPYDPSITSDSTIYQVNQYVWDMLFDQHSFRTIEAPESSVTPAPSATQSFIWTRLKTYQGLAGGCN